MSDYRFIISGGGTGGHIFPAISIANALKRKLPTAKFLFVGAEGRMEMERVPAAGYEIKGLPVSGFDRSNLLNNVKVLLRLFKSIRLARAIVKEFKPDVAVGVGGYASGPTLYAANRAGVTTVLQEQNSYAGVTNKLLAKKASAICVAYDGMEKFFPKDKIMLTGNPVRQDFLEVPSRSAEAFSFWGFDSSKPTVLIIGGSLGARTINNSIQEGLKQLLDAGLQVIWQTGKYYFEKCKKAAEPFACQSLVVTDFVKRMDYAYSVADLVVSRAGASSISELCLLGKPSILVPSPNVAEDHQTKNAMALSSKEAAVMVKDMDAPSLLVKNVIEVISNTEKLKSLGNNALALAQKDSADRIAEKIISLIKK